jgi:hypothetical protein
MAAFVGAERRTSGEGVFDYVAVARKWDERAEMPIGIRGRGRFKRKGLTGGGFVTDLHPAE